jgi:cytochrome c6
MKSFLPVLVLFATIWACGNAEKPTADATPVAQKEAIDGKAIFKVYCVQCHGLYGDMQLNGAKDLGLSILTVEERVAIITNGKNVMTPFKDLLSPEKIQAVAEYTMQFKK